MVDTLLLCVRCKQPKLEHEGRWAVARLPSDIPEWKNKDVRFFICEDDLKTIVIDENTLIHAGISMNAVIDQKDFTPYDTTQLAHSLIPEPVDPMTSQIRPLLSSFFKNKIRAELEIDATEAEYKYHEIGNHTGIHADSIYFLIELIKTFKLKNLVEIGSGFSTLFLSKLAQKYNLNFQSFEEEENYLILTRRLLRAYDCSDKVVQLYKYEDIPRIIDFLFIDCSYPLRFQLLKRTQTGHIQFVVVDDFEAMSNTCAEFMTRTSRQHFYVYTGAGRLNRLQFVSYPAVIQKSFSNFLPTINHFWTG